MCTENRKNGGKERMTRQEYYEALEHDNKELAIAKHNLERKLERIPSVFTQELDNIEKAMQKMMDESAAPDEWMMILCYYTGAVRGIDNVWKALDFNG